MQDFKDIVFGKMIAACVLLGTATAQAGGLSQIIDPAPQYAADGDWGGLYGGTAFGLPEVDAIALEDTANGIAAGVFGGYMIDLGKLVLGAEVEANLTAVESFSDDFPLSTIAAARIRVGYDLGQTQPYITSGVSIARLAGDVDEHDNGSFVGVGIDHMVSRRLSVGGAYAHYRYDDFAGTGSDFDVSMTSARLSFHF